MKAGAPAIARMHGDYWDLIRAADANWNNSREFFGHGVISRKHRTEPRGRYAGRRPIG